MIAAEAGIVTMIATTALLAAQRVTMSPAASMSVIAIVGGEAMAAMMTIAAEAGIEIETMIGDPLGMMIVIPDAHAIETHRLTMMKKAMFHRLREIGFAI